MTRKREVDGRFEEEFVPAELVAARLQKSEAKARKAPRPRFCKVYARARMAEAMPEIVEVLLTQARKGSVPHINLLLKAAGLDRGEVVPRATRRPGKSLEAMLLDGWREDQAKEQK